MDLYDINGNDKIDMFKKRVVRFVEIILLIGVVLLVIYFYHSAGNRVSDTSDKTREIVVDNNKKEIEETVKNKDKKEEKKKEDEKTKSNVVNGVNRDEIEKDQKEVLGGQYDVLKPRLEKIQKEYNTQLDAISDKKDDSDSVDIDDLSKYKTIVNCLGEENKSIYLSTGFTLIDILDMRTEVLVSNETKELIVVEYSNEFDESNIKIGQYIKYLVVLKQKYRVKDGVIYAKLN